MDLATNVGPSHIRNLRNFGDTDIDFLRQSEKLMKSGFLDTSTAEYGYYTIDIRHSSEGGDDFLVLINWLTLFTGSFIGLPTEKASFQITATLKIFDSTGTEIKNISKSGSFWTYASLYYGYGITERTAKEFRILFTDILQTISMQSSEINQALLRAGPITSASDTTARTKMQSAISASRPVQTAPVPSYSPPPTPQQPAFQQQTRQQPPAQRTYEVTVDYEHNEGAFGTRTESDSYYIQASSAQEAQTLAEGRWRNSSGRNSNMKFLRAYVTGTY